MKKVIVIVVVFLIMIGGMIGEITYVNKFYNGLQADLEAIAQTKTKNTFKTRRRSSCATQCSKNGKRASARC